ncbi:putative hybrid NRPS/PKS enzyme [Xylaria flabelliformis]|nr:putative hybrid NRPS/PKS enzyme [Xylaria flabelliformis]
MAPINEPIAIIGTGCRFPGQCDNPSKLWDLLRKPRDLLKEIPEERFSTSAFYHPQNHHHGTSNVRHSYLLEEDLRDFDAHFFGINSVEAHSVDPQQRLLLETVYESLEAAGLSVKELQGSDTAVYVGVMSADFTDMIGRDTETFPTYFATGTARSILSNRLSYFFDWHGPSMTIDTACSSSLIAMHQAVQVLRAGDSSVAVVAGSNLILGPEQYIAESKLQMLSPTGRSRMWDAAADGYARGEGVAAVVLKKLSQAIADGDHIECIIRETGLNQDGRTPGITMPSAAAQEALIRATYAKAGLDISKRADRPQFFEAHGTGTPAGDPVEASAVSNAFFGPDFHSKPGNPDDTLWVGSIKTVIGHTEGTAGLAAVIKASLALQAGVVPPNMLLSKVNPKIKPFYGDGKVQILSAAQKWPKLAEGGVRRVSVNSFGFGGANCHAILESYDPNATPRRDSPSKVATCFTPFVFSAASESTLTAKIDRYREYLAGGKASATVSLPDLSWTLSHRRSTLPWRAIVAATNNVEDLIKKLDDCTDFTNEPSSSSSARTKGSRPRILGIFTGQGAQWPRMGAELIEQSPAASEILARLDKSLQSLTPQDRPTWSLREHLLAGADSSSVATASISQPVCTAVQIMLVDMLKAAGIEFSAVVGHSSGEISAAYAVGYLSSEDAIRVAYYRGLHMKSLTQKGAMLAVGTSYEDAKELCELPAFEGRVCVAASNSPSSVTLSGDAEAIDEIKTVLDEEKKFTRLLKVDRAYHSHHMMACSKAYVSSLRECGIQQLSRAENNKCRWVSSVFTCDITDVPATAGLQGEYWALNLTRPVMFAEALQAVLGGNQDEAVYDLAIEVGPHPALKGPARQTIEECFDGQSIPYTGVLSRGKDSVESFSQGLGYIWQTWGEGAVNFATFNRFMNGEQTEGAVAQIVPLKNLPTYPWDHTRKFWHESRLSRAFRTGKDQPHELLGRQILDGAPDQLRWRNVLKRNEIDWLDGHQVQRQTVFPCAGYVSACVEASMRIRNEASVQSIELLDFVVGQAVTFNDDDSGVETLIVLDSIKESEEHGNEVVSAKFAFYSSNSEALAMSSHASCDVRVTYANSAENLLPPKSQENDEDSMLEVESDRFYNVLEQLGFGYSGPFRALTDLKRKLGKAMGHIQNPESGQLSGQPLLIHPAMLDAGIQSIMLAYCYPGDSMMRSIYLPTGIRRLTINPMHCRTFAGQETKVLFDSSASIDTSSSLSGDVSIYSPEGFAYKAIQLEGLQTQPLFHPTESNDLNIFTELVWDIDRPDSGEIVGKIDVQELDGELLFSLERVAYFYLRSLDKAIPRSERTNLEWHYTRLFAYVDHVLSRVSRGANRFAKKEWQRDTKDVIHNILDKYPDNIDLRLMHAVGENMPAVVRGEITMLEPMLQDNMLNDFYVIAHGMPRYTAYLAALASQIGHRYPHMHVLEIGAGTGGATKSFLGALGDKFSTYTFTDISGGFFEKAKQVFAAHSSRMDFKVLDIEKDIDGQGFAEGSYDVIIASLVLHATRDLGQTLRNVRRLLKPGGYLLLLEITENDQMRFGLLFGGLQGWWLGYDDGRALSPCIGIEEWETYLKQTGFSGIDTSMPHHEKLPVPLSVIVSQATDDRVEFLKQPLQQQESAAIVVPQLTIIGGAALATNVRQILGSSCGDVKFIESLGNLKPDDLPVGGTVLCLSDIEEPVFKSMNADKLRGFQSVFKQSTNVLWVTQGVRFGDPFSRMVVGFGRTIVLEMLHLRLQFLDLDTGAPPDPTAIAESLLRFQVAGNWENDDAESLPLLHSVEPELYLDNDNRFYIPRFKLNKRPNDRYNSGRRNITKQVSLREKTVELVQRETQDTPWYLVESGGMPELEAAVEIDVLYSVSRTVEVSRGIFLFPILGINRDTAETVLALSPKQASRVRVPQAFIIPAQESADYLQLFYTELLARAALRDVSAGTLVIVLQPSNIFSCAVDRIAADKGARVLHLALEPGTKWDYIHPKSTKADIQKLITLKVGTAHPSSILLLDMGAAKPLSTSLLECLPAEITLVKAGTLLTSSMARIAPSHLEQEIRSILVDIKYSLWPAQQAMGISQSHQEFEVVTLENLVIKEHAGNAVCIVSWPSEASTLSVRIEPIDTRVKFRSDGTYWLVGLTGGLGLSLCEWMAKQGARHIVVSSRNPKVDRRWVNKMKSQGVNVRAIANNIYDRESVRSVYYQICQEMPPIAGVAQGAMVLHDTVFSELDMERVEKVTQPKVNGSIYLEEIFQDVNLDFFVFFSSMACVTGNPGQSAYAAANMFMSGLAAQRRRRGLNASAVHIGAIFGNGYVTRELTLAQQEFLRKVGNMWLSEQDFRQLFAEAVFTGRVENGASPELSTGLMMIDNSDDSKKNITWFYNPMFQHCIKESEDSELVSDGQRGRGVPVKAQLQEAFNPAEVYEIIHDAFAAKLRVSLQIEENRPIVDLTADTLGIDSLFAVDIRSWFIKELQIEIPVLKILGGATVGEILDTAQQLLSKELTPNLDPNDKGEARKRKPQATSSAKDKVTEQTTKKASTKKPTEPTVTKPAVTKPTTTKASVSNETASDGKIDGTKGGAAPPPSVQWKGLPEPISPSRGLDDKSLLSENGVKISSANLSTTPSSTGSEIDGNGGQSRDSVWSFDTVENGMAISKKIPIGFGQSRIWFLEMYLKDPASALNITLTIDLNGSLDVGRFEKAVRIVGQRHEALRTRFVTGDDPAQTVQEVLVEPTLALEKQDISGDTEAEQIYRKLQQYRYKLTEGENMRILLLKKAPKSFRLVIGYHHINMDGISLEVVLRELQMAYDSKRLPSPSSILQYPTFSEQQHREFQSGQWKNEIAFWKKEFGGRMPPVLPLLPLAKTRSRTALTSYSSHTAEFRLDKEALARVQSACDGSKATPFQFHLAVFYTLLFRLVDVEDICIGVSSANRQDTTMMQSVGMYLNLLPLLLKSQPKETFASTLKLIRSKAMAAFAHSKVPFDVIVNELGVPRATTHSPLFQVLVNYRPGISERRDFCDCNSEVVSFEQGQAAFDLSLDIIESPGECRIIVAGQSALFEQQDVDMLKDMYRNLLVAFSRNPALRLTTPSLYDQESVKNALQFGRGSPHTHQWPETLVHRIDQIVERYGSRSAIVDGSGTSLTYSHLAKRVGSIAASMKIGSGSRVGVYVDPGADWVCSLLAILRRDAVYVPLDAVSGSGRLSAILQDSKPDLLIVNNATEKDARTQFTTLLAGDQILNIDNVSTTAAATISNAAKADSVAALMYTSGSTGVPKGIVMKHASFRNNIEIITDKLGYREGQEVTLQQSSLSFDMSLFQVFLALSNGGTLHVVPKHLRADPVAISSIIAKRGITFTTATPSELVSWIRFGNVDELRKSSWRAVQSGGEPVKDSLRAAFRKMNKPGLRLVDCYGPTEITFCSHIREVDYQTERTSPNTGLEVLPNYSTYIVDANMKPVPVGIPGEILIGGAGVVAGYLHTELNTRGFAHDSFAPSEFHNQGWTQLHRTGDFGRIDKANGCLLLEGRIMDDTQVKLRGLRIDLREVESAIIQAAKGTIADCAVSVRQYETSGEEYLVAFATTTSATKTNNLNQVIHQLPLPQYMRPAALVHLEKMPTNASGKIDRSALKSIPLPQSGENNGPGASNELSDSTESRLKQLWEGVLSKEIVSQHEISTSSDFFHVGGSSMLLVSLRADIQDTFNVEVSLFQLFDASTLGGMAALINDLSNSGSSDSAPAQDQSSEVNINWESETAVSPALLKVPVEKHFFTNPEVVVLTGATGFLGQAILTRLLNDGVVKKVHCLGVRHDIALFNSPKVVVHRGDLGLPRFGLSKEELSKIFAEAHAVIHNGTDVSFVKSYHSLKPVNVEATKELVRLSLPQHISFHYISTAAVANFTGQDSWEQRSVGGFLPPAGADGYLATKWVSERYLEKVSDQFELPIWIHRPSSITGPDAPATDLMQNLVQFSRKIAAVPETGSWRGWLDFISVDRAAMQIVDEVYEDYSWPGHVKFLYESGEKVVALSDMKGLLERENKSVVKTVPMEEWVSKAEEEGLNPLLGQYLKRASGIQLVFPRLVRHDSFL